MAHPAAAHRRPAETDKGLVAKVVALFLGLLVAVLGFFTLLMWADARDSRESELAATTATAHDHSAHASASGAVSFAGAAPANAEQLAKAHVAYPAALPAVPAGGVVKVHMVLKDVTVQIAPGVKYAAWGFEGGAPGPIVHVRQGQTVEMTLTNGGAIPHSIDFHAARIAPNEAFTDVMPGASFTFRSERPTRASTCTTAAPNRCSPISPTACTARSSSTRRSRCPRPTGSTCWSRASGTSRATG